MPPIHVCITNVGWVFDSTPNPCWVSTWVYKYMPYGRKNSKNLEIISYLDLFQTNYLAPPL